MTDLPRVTDPALRPIAEKVVAGQSLSHTDGLTLYATRDVHGLGRLANFVRERFHSDRTYFNRNRHINYTNVCALSCKFCSFYRKRGEEGAYEMPVEQVIATARRAADAGATEVHIVGGLHPWLKFDYYLEMLRGIRVECPSLHVKAFTAIEIIHFSRISRQSVRDVLIALREAGLGSLPGGGAEIFDDRVHDEVFKGKVRADKWFEVHRTAHSLGIYSNATMLYGHVEMPAERVGHLIKLRELQGESLLRMKDEGGRMNEVGAASSDSSFILHPSSLSSSASFNCMIPLSFAPEQSELGHLPGNTGLTDLKTLAISRLMLDNIAHIKAFWIMQGVGLAQLALSWGCDDLDGTVVWYDITKRAGDEHRPTHQEMHVSDLRRLIREAGREPVERDTLYRPLQRSASDAAHLSRGGGVAEWRSGQAFGDAAGERQAPTPPPCHSATPPPPRSLSYNCRFLAAAAAGKVDLLASRETLGYTKPAAGRAGGDRPLRSTYFAPRRASVLIAPDPQRGPSVNHRSAFRAFRSWASTAAACGFAFGVAVAVVGCDKKPDPANPAPASATGGVKGAVGILDANKMATALGWGTDQAKQIEAVGADLKRELKSFVDALDKAIEDERKKIIASNRLTKAEDINNLTKFQDLDKLPIKKEDLNEYVMVVQRAQQAAQQGQQYANQAMNQWKQQVDQIYTEAAKPAVRRAAQERGVQAVFLSGVVLHHDTSVDITDKVIDELQKSPVRPNFPPSPKLGFPPVSLDAMTKPTTQPIVPAPPTTLPSR